MTQNRHTYEKASDLVDAAISAVANTEHKLEKGLMDLYHSMRAGRFLGINPHLYVGSAQFVLERIEE